MTGPGTIASRYLLREAIGGGGRGIVYRAYDTFTRRDVAIKAMNGAVEPTALALFSKEQVVLSKLNHPNIVEIFDAGEFEDDGRRKPFFVMPFLAGRTLDYLIRDATQPLTVERVLEIVMQTCRGLQAAHESGFIHRDLKPSNIFVMEDDTVKIIDFGVVHLTGSDTVTSVEGTLQYMAPEQIEIRPTSPASDIFSLAVVCYEALTSRKPFARKDEAETVEALRHYIPLPVCELNPLVSQLVSRVIHKAMAKAPYHRFSTAREFSETLQKALNNQLIEWFDKSKTAPRVERAKKAQAEGDFQFALEVLLELEAEGHIDPDMTKLRLQINQAIRQKSIRQLLESARTRREEDEFPLALQKIQEVAEIDPDNADALRLHSDIEKERGNRQLENLLRLVDQHVHQHSFAQARQALEETLKLDASNVRARELLVDVARREQELNRVRAEKEQLYHAAVSSYEQGEVSSALSKIERVLEFSRTAPDSANPDRDAQCLELYNQIRTEWEAARTAYEEGRRCVVDKNFDRALEICVDFLKRFPADPLFQALKLEAEENRRQEDSSFLAEVVRRAEAEPDLNRRVNILKEGADRYPDEAHFQQSLRLTRERRDLVNAIVAGARRYEDRGQFGEALGQWYILRNIYAQYPGIEFEIERLTRLRDQQGRDEARARWVEQIDQARAPGDYGLARHPIAQPSEKHLRNLPATIAPSLKLLGRKFIVISRAGLEIAGAAKRAIASAGAKVLSKNSEGYRKARRGTPEMPAGALDRVYFTVTSKRCVQPRDLFEVYIWAHLEEHRDTVISRSQVELNSTEIHIGSKGPVHVARSTTLSVHLDITDMVVDDPDDTILWAGGIGNAIFLVRVPPSAKLGRYTGVATIRANGCQIAKLHFTVQVGRFTFTIASVEIDEHRHRRAFASYATEDRDEVLARVQGIQKAAPELDVFLDVISLRSGTYWEKQLRETIPESDVFYLFWSRYAMNSLWVEKEWRCALNTRGLDFIDPVPLVHPKDAPPPPELASKHFSDPLLHFFRDHH